MKEEPGMETTLAENIRAFRKQRNMTQEQLSCVLGVTAGAVHKWESGLSVPELNLILEMADFFDVSVDALLGYRMKNSHPDSVAGRLYDCCRSMDPAGPAEAEKALGKYPHSFPIVHACADLYLVYGTGTHDPRLLRRALDLFGQARVLLPQNDNPRFSDATISGKMAAAWMDLGEFDKALEIMKQNNADAHFSDQIGSTLAAFMGRPEEAVPWLSEAIVNGMSNLLNAALGYVFLYRARKDWDSAVAIASLTHDLIAGLRTEAAPGYMDKTLAEVLLLLAYTRMKAGQPEAAETALRQAAELAARFDSDPEFSLRGMRFLEHTEQTSAFDILGATAVGSIGRLLALLDDADMNARWKEITREP